MSKVQRVLLFVPPAYTFKHNIDINPMPTMGIGYLAAVLRKKGIEVKIFDSLIEGWTFREEINDVMIRVGTPFTQIEEIVREFKPDLVGVNMLFTKQKENAHKIFEIAKKVSPSIITVGGGPHATVMPEDVLADRNVDFVALGEGENTIIDLLEVIEGHKSVGELDGIAFRANGKNQVVPKTKFIMNLDDLPFPAWDLMQLEKYFELKMSHGARKRKRFSPIITSRGCSAKCTFCSAYRTWGRKFRVRSPENVLAEMSALKERYGIEELIFEDDNVTFDKARAKKIFGGMIERKLDFVWDTPNGVAAYSLDTELIQLMKKSGCYKLNLALESGNQEVLNKIIKKPLRLDRVKPLIEYAKKIKLDVGIFLIIGLPGEKIEQMYESFQLSADLGIYDPFISVATPYPGTELFEQCVSNGYLNSDFSTDDLFIRSFVISTEDWKGEQLRDVLANGYRYLLWQKLKNHPFKVFRFYVKAAINNPDKVLLKIRSYLKRINALFEKEVRS